MRREKFKVMKQKKIHRYQQNAVKIIFTTKIANITKIYRYF